MSLTGYWRLSREDSTSQKDLLKVMGKSRALITVVDSANENYFLVHFCQNLRKGKIHYFHKDVEIFLLPDTLGTLLNALRIIGLSLNINRVHYKHNLVANGKSVEHKDDEKQFGLCESVTTWSENDNGFIIRWVLKEGVLKVLHQLNEDGQLECHMEMKTNAGKIAHAKKVYNRQKLLPKHNQYFENHKKKEFIV